MLGTVCFSALGLRLNRALRDAEVSGDGLDALVQGTVGVGLLVGFGEHPAEKRFDAIAGGHGIAGAGDVGFEFVGRTGLGVGSQVFEQVGEFVAEDEGPGVWRDFAGGDGMDVDGAIVDVAADGDQGTGIGSMHETPANLAAGGLGDFTGDCLKLGKVLRRAIAGIRASGARPSVGSGGRFRGCKRSAPGEGGAG